MNYEISYDVSKFLDASIEKVIHTLVEAFILVAIVVFLFLGDWRSTLHPCHGGTGIIDRNIYVHAVLWHHAKPHHAVCAGNGDRCGGG